MFSRKSRSSSPPETDDQDPTGDENNSGDDRSAEQRRGKEFGYAAAMQRLIYVALFGFGIIVLYSYGASSNGLVSATVGLMSAGAAMLVGGLVGFLFGVPHLRVADEEAKSTAPKDGQVAAGGSADRSASRYTPSESLEQISDWLTKIIVGVGLIDFTRIVGQLDLGATRIQNGMGIPKGGNVFALGLLLYFIICGFTFGFLWARLYLVDWFRKADDVKQLQGKVSLLEQRQQEDAKALALILPYVSGDVDSSSSDEEILDAIKRASKSTREQIFERVRAVSANYSGKDEPNFEIIIQVLKALIATDRNGRHFEFRGELSYALSRKRPWDLNEAEKSISEAIRLRDQYRQKGWRYYEFRRALYRIQLEPDKAQTRPEVSKMILADLTIAHTDKEKWHGWVKEPDVMGWLRANHLTEDLTAEQQG